MTINELIANAHSAAKTKGFWNTERNTGELLMLIVSECGEALEAHRKNRMGTLSHFEGLRAVHADFFGHQFKEDFEQHIKDTFEDELADIVIRIADYIGGTERMFFGTEPSLEATAASNVGEELLEVVTHVIDGSSLGLTTAVYHVFGIANAHNIDLWKHIELKMAYNETREHRHGKMY